jgi:glyoxylase-like metal-dependent hydrolase (beta-lactamase superfamily II)
MLTLNPTTRLIDLQFLGRSDVIGTGVIDTPDGLLLVDPGPASCLPVVRQELAAAGARPADLRGILVTHIHLDHAGATGTIVRENPDVKVYVHERGAPHLIDPSKLLASATRLYGADMDRLWGEFAAVPASNVVVLTGGETFPFGGHPIDVAYAPGHAWHHVAYHDTISGVVFAGDTGGIRIGTHPYVLPPTPPPDIDLAAWRASIDQFRRWQPSGIFVTHFGLHTDADAHLTLLGEELDAWERVSRDLIDIDDDAAREPRFVEGVLARISERAGPQAAEAYQQAVPLEHCWMGLARYWKKRLERNGAS